MAGQPRYYVPNIYRIIVLGTIIRAPDSAVYIYIYILCTGDSAMHIPSTHSMDIALYVYNKGVGHISSGIDWDQPEVDMDDA